MGRKMRITIEGEGVREGFQDALAMYSEEHHPEDPDAEEWVPPDSRIPGVERVWNLIDNETIVIEIDLDTGETRVLPAVEH